MVGALHDATGQPPGSPMVPVVPILPGPGSVGVGKGRRLLQPEADDYTPDGKPATTGVLEICAHALVCDVTSILSTSLFHTVCTSSNIVAVHDS